MAYTLHIDDTFERPLASIGGLRELRTFAEKNLPVKSNLAIRQLLEHGKTYDRDGLTAQVETALGLNPSEPVAHTLRDLAQTLADGPQKPVVIFISDGVEVGNAN